jgi:glucose-6-phosphate isomerase
MSKFHLNIDNAIDFTFKDALDKLEGEVVKSINTLNEKNGDGNHFLGWLNLPSTISEEHIVEIEQTAKFLKAEVDYVIVVGIGGSYLGSKAIIEALSNSFDDLMEKRNNPKVLFAGQNIVEDYLSELLSFLKDKKFAIVVISKSGTTTEPAIAFRLLKDLLETKFGKEKSRELIISITDKEKGALRQLTNKEGYKSFVIPDDTGGRFSVLTPVGLLPIAIAGFSIRDLIKGAAEMESMTGPDVPYRDNPSAIYAAIRNALYRNGKKIEILANYNNKLVFFSEWWKQLYGESEGKDGKGIFPASVYFTADLHSMGQYIQEGERTLFETVISIKKPNHTLTVPKDQANLDDLNYLAGKRINDVNKMAELGTMIAHIDGGVPNIKIEIEEISEYALGELIYFFEKACGISGYMLEVNPFNQPGVEAYKKNMFALLEKPGFEEETKNINKRL